MNKKGYGQSTMIFVLVIFGIVWIAGLSVLLNGIGAAVITSGNTSGIDSWFYSNLNLVVGLAYFASWYMVLR